MFTSFNESDFINAIETKDFDWLKVGVYNSIMNDPAFELNEVDEIISVLKKEVPEIFEEYVVYDYEERLDSNNWDKEYFIKLVYWFQENFSLERLDYIKEVGRALHQNVARINEEATVIEECVQQAEYVAPVATMSDVNVTREESENFMMTRAMWMMVALVIVGALMIVLMND